MAKHAALFVMTSSPSGITPNWVLDLALDGGCGFNADLDSDATMLAVELLSTQWLFLGDSGAEVLRRSAGLRFATGPVFSFSDSITFCCKMRNVNLLASGLDLRQLTLKAKTQHWQPT